MSNFSQKSQVIIEAFQKDRGELPVQQSEELVEFKSLMKDYIRYKIMNEHYGQLDEQSWPWRVAEFGYEAAKPLVKKWLKPKVIGIIDEIGEPLGRKTLQSLNPGAAAKRNQVSTPRQAGDVLSLIGGAQRGRSLPPASYGIIDLGKDVIGTPQGKQFAGDVLSILGQRAKQSTRSGAEGALDLTRHLGGSAIDLTRKGAGAAIDLTRKGAGSAIDLAGEGAGIGWDVLKALNPKTINQQLKDLPGPLKYPFRYPGRTITATATAGELSPLIGKGMEKDPDPITSEGGSIIRDYTGKSAIEHLMAGNPGDAVNRAVSYTIPSSWGMYTKLGLEGANRLGLDLKDNLNRAGGWLRSGAEESLEDSGLADRIRSAEGSAIDAARNATGTPRTTSSETPGQGSTTPTTSSRWDRRGRTLLTREQFNERAAALGRTVTDAHYDDYVQRFGGN
jgi:hypothetical protein